MKPLFLATKAHWNKTSGSFEGLRKQGSQIEGEPASAIQRRDVLIEGCVESGSIKGWTWGDMGMTVSDHPVKWITCPRCSCYGTVLATPFIFILAGGVFSNTHLSFLVAVQYFFLVFSSFVTHYSSLLALHLCVIYCSELCRPLLQI